MADHPSSDHFDGKRFVNPQSTGHGELGKLLRWGLTRKQGPWHPRRDEQPGPAPATRVEQGLRVTMVGHATVLIQTGGLNLLTDPVWSERCSPVSWAGPRRVRPAGIAFDTLPPIDAVLLSHDHYDHLDLPTLRKLHERDSPRVFTGLGVGGHLRGLGEVTELDWWDEATLGPLRINAVPARHFSGRTPFDRDHTLWLGLWVRGPAGSLMFAGDTGMGSHFAQMRERLGAPDVALLPIGAYRPQWFMQPVHMSPAEAVEAHVQLGATVTVPIHYGVFPLADDGEDEPLEDLREALAQADEPTPRFHVLAPGEGHTFAAAPAAVAAP
ncbi:MAG: MBL fold metallo-hydrolase [Deltaproteobacteria bacterium]|nr:MBL fold metallo-hydrolase [Deltaproteobacteria bacterium]